MSMVQTAMLIKHFALGNTEEFNLMFDKFMNSNHKGLVKLGGVAFYYALFINLEKGFLILKKLMNENMNFPIYYYGITTLYHYRKKEYNQALIEANHYTLTGIFWGPLHRVAALGQLNRKDEATPEIAELKKLKPDFEEKADYLISRFVKEDDLVTHLLAGLGKAGMVV